MVICKFFLQGTCRYGENCRFEHQISHNNMGGNGNFQTFQSKQQTNEIDINTLITSVRNDMLFIERSGQWLLTCYAPFKEEQTFPGFQDQSFEEVRFGFYEARKNNTMDQYKQQLQQAFVEARTKFKALLTPTEEMIALFRNIYNSNSITGMPQNNAPFNSNATAGNSIFGQNSNTQGSIFGSQNTVQRMNQQSSIFQQQNTGGGSIFNQQNNSNNIFMQKNSIFANANKNLFINQQNNQQFQFANTGSNQQYSQQSKMQSQNIFSAANKNIFAAQQPSQPPPQQFGNISNNSSVFNVQPNSIFGQNLNEQNVQFQQPQQNNTAINMVPLTNQNQHSIFTNNSNRNFVSNSGNSDVNVDVYSKMEDLSESDINWFKSNDLDVDKMPENPPTYEMCFN